MTRRRFPGDWDEDRVRPDEAKTTNDDGFCGLVSALSDMRRDLNDLRLLVLDMITMPNREVVEGDLRDLSRRIEKMVVRRDLAHMHATALVPMIIEHQKTRRAVKEVA